MLVLRIFISMLVEKGHNISGIFLITGISRCYSCKYWDN